jgi:uncharacterized protein (DUF58 family)
VKIPRTPWIGTVYLTGLLLSSIPFAPTTSIWIVIILVGMQGILIFHQSQSPIQLVVTISSILISPQVFTPVLGPILSLFLIVPVLFLFDSQLRKTTFLFRSNPSLTIQRTTIRLKALLACLMSTSIWALIIDSPILIISSICLILTVSVRFGWEFFFLKTSPINIGPKRIRILAGTEQIINLEITNPTSFSIKFNLFSKDNFLSIAQTNYAVTPNTTIKIPITIKCQLSGPRWPEITLLINGPNALFSNFFFSHPLEIRVIPRARYASWLAEKYLQGTGSEGIETNASDNLGAITGKIRGVEFQQLREYQPGDKIRQIDWNHTHKIGRYFVRERLDPSQGDVMIILNTTAETPEEADWIAYNLVMSSLSASQQGLPSSILAYNDNRPISLNSNLRSKYAVQKSLDLASRIHRREPAGRKFKPPDVNRLRQFSRNNTNPIGFGEHEGLEKFLLVELNAIKLSAESHPLASTIQRFLSKATKDTTITLVSCWNHDAEILSITLPKLRKLGYKVVDLMSEKGLGWI